MSYKPSDVFLTVSEFFAVILPGALVTFLISNRTNKLFGSLFPPLTDSVERWIAFLIAAYIFGHILHHIGGILDKWFYDKLYVKRWKRRKGEEKLLRKSRELIRGQLGADADMTSAFSWAGSFVRAHSEPAAGELERGGADSKFFRSLFLVAVLAGVLFVCKSIPVVLCAGALAAFSLWRYFDRRWKNSQLTYEYFIMLKLEEAERKRVESKL